MPHGRLPDQRKCVGFGQIVSAHDLQNRGEDDAPGPNTILQFFEMCGFINSSLGGIERNHQRGVKSGRAQRLDQERRGLQVKQPLQPAGRLGSDQCNDRGLDLPRTGRIRLDRNAVCIQDDDIKGLIRWRRLVGIMFCNCHAQAVELAAQD